VGELADRGAVNEQLEQAVVAVHNGLEGGQGDGAQAVHDVAEGRDVCGFDT